MIPPWTLAYQSSAMLLGWNVSAMLRDCNFIPRQMLLSIGRYVLAALGCSLTAKQPSRGQLLPIR